MSFEYPLYLAAGALAALVLVVASRALDRKRRRALEDFAAPGLVPKLAADVSRPKRLLKTVLLAAAILALFAALARPKWGSRWEEVSQRGIDIVIALDTSRSMLAEDVTPSRLERAKLSIFDFVSRLKSDRVALIPFAGQAFVLCPLTLDYSAFLESMEAVDTGIIPAGGTDIASAIRSAANAFESDSSHKILVLITDGEDLEGEALAAAKAAGDDGVTIYTIGVGTPNGQQIPLAGGGLVKDADGNPVRSALDEDALRQIAATTGGTYAPLNGAGGAGLDAIYTQKLALVPQEELTQRMKESAIERFEWPLALGLALLAAEFLIGTRKTRRRSAVPPAAVGLVALALLPSTARAADGEPDPRVIYNAGTEAFAQADWESAAQAFRGTLTTTDLSLQNRAYYNLGSTLYRQGEAAMAEGADQTVAAWEAAIDAFDGALNLDPDDADAAFNKAFVEKKLKELEDQQQEQQDDQQQDQEESEDEESEEEQEEQDGDQSDESEEGESEEEQESSESGEEEEEDGESAEEESGSDPGEEGDPQEGEEQSGEEEGEDGEEESAPEESDQEGESEEEPNQRPADQEAQPAEERRIAGEMSQEEARQLLESLMSEDGSLGTIPFFMPQPPKDSKGGPKRDW